jgi:5-methylcytosine-specific restriction protein A
MACSGYEEVDDDDVNGDPRRAIVFQLVPVGAEEETGDEQDLPSDLDALRAAAASDPTEEQDPQEGRRRTYARSRALKRYVRARAGGQCEGCEHPAPFTARDGSPYLEPHHTLRRSDHGPGNPRTVIALCPVCHARIHYGADGDEYNEELKAKLPALEAG